MRRGWPGGSENSTDHGRIAARAPDHERAKHRRKEIVSAGEAEFNPNLLVESREGGVADYNCWLEGMTQRWAKILWRWHRLRSMSPGEVLLRARDAALGLWEETVVRRRWMAELRRETPVKVPDQRLLAKLAAAERVKLRHQLEAQFPGLLREVLREASEIKLHRFTIFGSVYPLGKSIDWHRNFRSGRSIPRRFYRRIDYRDPALVGEVKVTWELNRHQHLLRLAQAYLLTGDASYLEETLNQLASWVEQNPPLVGVNWTRSLEVALRLLSWSWVLAQLWPALESTGTRLRLVLRSAEMQLRYLRRHISYGSSANNHRIGELLGLAWGTAFFDGDRVGATRALRRLFAEIARQVCSDGVSVERSTYYHGYVLLYGLLGEVLARWIGEPVSNETTRLHDRMADFLLDLHAGDGQFALFGDEDGGHVLPLASHPNLLRDALEMWACLRETPLPESLNPSGEMPFWLLGRPVLIAERERCEPLRLYAEGGFAAVRLGQDHRTLVAMDAGPLGDDRLAAHGHADCLSVTWFVNGQPILLDPGTYAYDGERAWRDFFRSTAAHNTVVVDGRSQASSAGTFLWRSRYRGEFLLARSSKKGVVLVGAHDGYRDIGVRHVRTVVVSSETVLTFVDLLEGTGEHTVDVFFHCPVGTVEVHADRKVTVWLPEHRVEITAPGSRPLRMDVFAGDEQVPLGWTSPAFGQRGPCITVRWRYEGSLPVSLVTHIQLTQLYPEE